MPLPRFLVVDTETTGFMNSDRVLEVGFAFCEEGKIVDSYNQRLNPKDVDWGSASVQKALEVNHIDRKDLDGAPDISDIVDHLMLMFRRYHVWVGHNLKFDLRMLANEFKRAGKELPVTSSTLRICTLEQAKRAHFRDKSHKLCAVAERYGVKLSNAHTAVGDAMATAEVFLRMWEEKSFSSHLVRALETVGGREQEGQQSRALYGG